MHGTWIGIAAQFLVFGGLASWGRLSRILRAAWSLAALAIVATAVTAIAAQVVAAYAHPPAWDYRCFWLYARAAVLAHQPYSPAAMHALDAVPAPADPQWRREVLDVGMVYPPPTVLLFAPLAFFRTLSAGVPFWYTVLLASLAAEIVAVWRICFRGFGAAGLLGTAALVTSFPATVQTVAVGQTVFLLVLLLAVYWRGVSPVIRGAALGLAFAVKPIAIVLWFFDVVRGQRRTALSAAAMVCALTLLVVPIIGVSSIASYVVHGPLERIPASLLDESAQQSLLAMLLRAAHAPPAGRTAPILLYLAIALTAFVLTAIALRNVKGDRDLAIGSTLPVALLLYPQSLYFYSGVMLIPICIAWMRRDCFPGGIASVVLLAAVVSAYPFWGWLATWTLFTIHALQRRPASTPEYALGR